MGVVTAEASAWAIDVVVGDPIAKLVLVALSDWAVPGQRCRLRIGRLAARTELEPEEVIDRLLMLHRRGYLAYLRIDKGAQSFEYTLPDSETMQSSRAREAAGVGISRSDSRSPLATSDEAAD